VISSPILLPFPVVDYPLVGLMFDAKIIGISTFFKLPSLSLFSLPTPAAVGSVEATVY
jgi:hypothetical protein